MENKKGWNPFHERDGIISDLERKVKYLEGQLNKYKTENNALKSKPFERYKGSPAYEKIKELEEKLRNPEFLKKRSGQHARKVIEDLNAKVKKYKRLQHQNGEFKTFLRKRIIKLYGKQKYIDIVNTIDNPCSHEMIRDVKAFLAGKE